MSKSFKVINQADKLLNEIYFTLLSRERTCTGGRFELEMLDSWGATQECGAGGVWTGAQAHRLCPPLPSFPGSPTGQGRGGAGAVHPHVWASGPPVPAPSLQTATLWPLLDSWVCALEAWPARERTSLRKALGLGSGLGPLGREIPGSPAPRARSGKEMQASGGHVSTAHTLHPVGSQRAGLGDPSFLGLRVLLSSPLWSLFQSSLSRAFFFFFFEIWLSEGFSFPLKNMWNQTLCSLDRKSQSM